MREVVNQIWPGKLQHGYEPRDWNYSDILSKQDWDEVWRAIDGIPDFWETIPPITENVIALQKFLRNESDHEIYYLTSRRATLGRPVTIQCEQWLVNQQIWPEDNYHAVLVVDHPSSKRLVMSVLDIQFSIDDKGRTVSECNDVKGHKAYLMDAPHNRAKDYGTRVFSLDQFLNMVTGKMPADYFLV